MGRRGRSFLGFVLVGAGALAFYLWRNRRVRDYTRALLAPAGDRVRDIVRRALKHKTDSFQPAKQTRIIVTGLCAPEVRPLSTADQLLSWTSDAAVNGNPDEPFCRAYNSPLLLPPPPASPALAGAPSAVAAVAEPGLASAAGGDGAGGSVAGGGSGGGAGGSGSPRLLVCHDMMGGYLADRLVQGSADPGAFRLWHWDQIDVFIYFSHHLVTVPPPGWTAAAHRNGVKVLGTFITEWGEGRELCESSLFCSPAAARRVADRLVELAAHGGFEGWLLNIENGLRRELVPVLAHFVGYLRARMAAVVGPHALVIWYDAITTEGRLAWQDGLTPLNRPFFDSADALFVNYRWKEEAPPLVAEAAGGRAADVFLGVDVFGRGSYGGGKDNCPVALSAARAAGLSAALFAPGWVYEEFDRTTFEPRQEAFWAAIRAVWPPRGALVQRLPLCTAFNCGSGRAVWLEGRRVSEAPWHHLAAMDVVAATTTISDATAAAATAAAAAAPQAPERLEEGGPDAARAGAQASGAPTTGPAPQLAVRTTQQLAFCGGSCLALTAPPPPPLPRHPSVPGPAPASPAPATPAQPPAAATPTTAGLRTHVLFTAHVPVPAAGFDLSYTAACSGLSRVGVLLRMTLAGAGGGSGGGGGHGAAASCGVAVGPWGEGDAAVVEAVRREGYTCVSCPATPTGAATCPLPDPLTAATSAALAASTSAATATAPAGLPWMSYTSHVPANLSSSGGSSTAAGAVLTGIAVVCYRAAVAGGTGPLLGPGSGGAGGRPSSSSTRGSASGYVAGAGAGATAATTAAAIAAAVSSALDGGGDDQAPYQAFLGRLTLREHCHAASTPHPSTAGPPPSPTTTTTTTPLAGGRCSRVRWTRPGASGSSRARSLRSSYNSLTAPGRAAAAVAAAAAATAAAAAIAAGSDPAARELRVSEELVERSEDVEEGEEGVATEEFQDDYEVWERSSSGGGAFVGGSPVKVAGPVGTRSGDDGGGDAVGPEDDVAAEAGSSAGGGAVRTAADDPSNARLLTCELSWEPQFDVYGMPRHRSYHVWAHFDKAARPAVAAQSPPPRAPAGVTGAAAVAAQVAAAASPSGEAAWEVLHPDWSGAVWAGEAFVARYRLVQLEVPTWAAAVTLLVQPVCWASGQVQPMQQLAYVPAPPPQQQYRQH